MKTTLTKIGNSKGIIIPAHFLKECQFDNVVSINIENDKIMISKPEQPRSGWKDAFAKALPNKNELLIDDTLSNHFDEDEWSW